MTFPAKENLIFFEKLEKLQTRLWDDACDEGIDLTKYPVHKAKARENLLALMKCYAYKMERHGILNSDTTLFIPFEFDEGAYLGVTLNVAYSVVRKREYLLINITHARKTHAEIEGKLFKL